MKTQTKIPKTKSLLLISISALLLASCTKEIPFETLKPNVKQDDIPRNLIDEESEHLMSISMLNASRTSTDALPFASGDNKRVKLQLTKNSLRILETERDQRYTGNTANDKLVVEIPAEYARYECAKDRFGECTNKEEESGDSDWKTKPIVRLKLEDGVKITELNFLPIFESQTFGSNCYTETSRRLVSSKIEADAINLTLEVSFLTNIDCLSELDKISDASVRRKLFFS